ncbi:MAG: tyrosine-type recombinase/integrase [Campylobacterota bacterium]|nr:tyrosine-type recombinase/integrase [Campylobacterota bacterium]
MAYAGVTTKISKNGSKSIYVRFKHNSKTYPVKNFTKLFGCKTEKQAFDKLQEVKILISQGKDPFISSPTTLNDIFDQRVIDKVNNGEWTNNTPTNYLYFYNSYVRNTIGHKKIEKITYEDLLKVQKQVSHLSSASKNLLKMILRPVFAEEVKKENIYKSVIDKLETYNTSIRESLETRVKETHLDVVKKLYHTIPQYNATKKSQKIEVKIFLYLTLLTAHRYGEILQLRKEDCYMDKQMIMPPKEITKTKDDYRFPIPDECLSYIENIESGLLFPNMNRSGIYAMFKKFVKLANIDLYNNKSISMHDTRKFMLTIMIRDCKIDSVLADTCLNHKQRGIIKHYLSFTYEDVNEAYQKYWNVIRAV